MKRQFSAQMLKIIPGGKMAYFVVTIYEGGSWAWYEKPTVIPGAYPFSVNVSGVAMIFSGGGDAPAT